MNRSKFHRKRNEKNLHIEVEVQFKELSDTTVIHSVPIQLSSFVWDLTLLTICFRYVWLIPLADNFLREEVNHIVCVFTEVIHSWFYIGPSLSICGFCVKTCAFIIVEGNSVQRSRSIYESLMPISRYIACETPLRKLHSRTVLITHLWVTRLLVPTTAMQIASANAMLCHFLA